MRSFWKLFIFTLGLALCPNTNVWSSPNTSELCAETNGVPTTLSGIISNPVDKDIGLRFYQDNISFDEELFNIPVSANNDFSMSFNLLEPTTAFLSYYGLEISIYIEPGDNLKLNFEGLNFLGSLKFSGKGAAHNNYLLQANNLTRQWDSDFILYEIVQRGPMSYRRFMDNIRKTKWDFYKDYSTAEKSKFTNTFNQFLSAEINYWWAYNLLRYRTEHAISNGMTPPMLLPSSYYDFLDEISVSNDNAINSRQYIYFIDQYLNFRNDKKSLVNTEDYSLRTMVVTSPSMLLLAEPNKPPVIMELKNGERVKYLNEKSDFKSQILIKDALHEDFWYKVKTIEGITGWLVGVGVEFDEYEKKEAYNSNEKNAKSYLKGKALAHTLATQIYWRLHLENAEVMKEEVNDFLAECNFPSYNHIIQNAFDESVLMKGGTTTAKVYGAVNYRLINDPQIGDPVNDETVVIASVMPIEKAKPNEEVAVLKKEKPKKSKKTENAIVSDFETSPIKIDPPIVKPVVPKPSLPFRQTRKEVFVDLPKATRELPKTKTEISGRINTPTGQALTLVIYKEPILFDRNEFNFKIGNDYSFGQNVGLTTPCLAALSYGNKELPLYLEPGDRMNLIFNGLDFSKTIIYEGKGAVHNNYLKSYYTTFQNVDRVVSSKAKSLDANAFKSFLQNQKQKRLAFLENYHSKDGFSRNFYQFARAEITYWYAYQMLNFPWENALANNFDEPQNIPVEYYDFLSEIPISDNQALPSMNYTYFLNEFFSYQVRLKYNEGVSKLELAEKYLNGDVLNYFKAKNYTTACKRGKASGLGQEIKSFIEENDNEIYNSVLRMAYREAKGIEHGSEAPAFDLKDVNGTTVSLSDFKGKVVYLDFWASWCSPCVLKMRNSREWKSQFRDKDVVFVYVSLDKNKGAWKNFLAGNSIEGIHVSSNEQNVFKSEIAREYLVKRLPATFLIDKNGKISYNSAKDSGTGRVSDYITNLLFAN